MNCLDNLEKCKANCCKVVGFNLIGNVSRFVVFDTMTKDIKHYNELHGFQVKRLKNRKWQVIIPEYLFKKAIITKKQKDEITIKIPVTCSALKDNKCSLHGTNQKPYWCNDLREETTYKYFLTEGCIYK